MADKDCTVQPVFFDHVGSSVCGRGRSVSYTHLDVYKRQILDDASPVVTGTLAKNIRIAVLKTPVVDEEVGLAASIRIVNPQSMKKEDFISGGTATGEMLDFLSECIRYGISVCVAGATSSGKTTVAGWLLTTIPDRKRIFTIENGSRELDLIREESGKVLNSVVHTLSLIHI